MVNPLFSWITLIISIWILLRVESFASRVGLLQTLLQYLIQSYRGPFSKRMGTIRFFGLSSVVRRRLFRHWPIFLGVATLAVTRTHLPPSGRRMAKGIKKGIAS